MVHNEGNYIAVSRNPQTYTLEDVFDRVIRPGSTISKAEALANFEAFTGAIMALIEQGDAVVTPLVNIRSNIKGVFEEEDALYHPERQQISINMTPGKRLRAVGERVRVTKITAKDREPELFNFYDNVSSTRNEVITPGKGGRITGMHLKFDETDDTQGVFFVNKEDGSSIRMDARPLRHKPKELIFINPDLPAGSYELEVRSGLLANTRVRVGRLPMELKVV